MTKKKRKSQIKKQTLEIIRKKTTAKHKKNAFFLSYKEEPKSEQKKALRTAHIGSIRFLTNKKQQNIHPRKQATRIRQKRENINS